jgi:hypothetical protein
VDRERVARPEWRGMVPSGKGERREQIVQVVVVIGKSFRCSRDKMAGRHSTVGKARNFGHEGVASRVSSRRFAVVFEVLAWQCEAESPSRPSKTFGRMSKSRVWESKAFMSVVSLRFIPSCYR